MPSSVMSLDCFLRYTMMQQIQLKQQKNYHHIYLTQIFPKLVAVEVVCRCGTMFSSVNYNDSKEPFHGNSNSTFVDTSTDDGSNATMSNGNGTLNEDTLPSPTTQSSTTIESNNNPPTLADNDEMAALMAQVNDSLERELKETKKAVKRIFKEIVAFHEVSKSVLELWAPIQNAEHQESLRLDELQAEVHGTIGAYSLPMDSLSNSVASTTQH